MTNLVAGVHAHLSAAHRLVGVILVVCSVTLSGDAAPVRAQPVEAQTAAVVFQLFDALNHYDADTYAALFAEDAFMINPVGMCSPATPCSDRDAIRSVVVTAPPHVCETITHIAVDGSIVTARFEVRHDGLRARGIERVIASVMAEVRDGLIHSYFARTDVSDPETALSGAIAAGNAQPGKPLATPSTQCGGSPGVQAPSVNVNL